MIQRFFVIFLFVILHGAVRSQDTIVRNDGSIIIAKITEITPTEIKYNRFDLLNGPVYVESKTNIIKIKYFNGVTDTFKMSNIPTAYSAPVRSDSNKIEYSGRRYRYKDERYSENEIQDILLNTKDKKIANLVKEAREAKSLQYVGFVGIPLGAVGLIAGFFGLLTWADDPTQDVSSYVTVAALCTIGAIACPIISVSYKTKRKRCNQAAVNLFNKNYSKE